jgi:hypothetical protein
VHRASDSRLPSAATYQAYESIQKNLTGEFSKKLDAWEKKKSSVVHAAGAGQKQHLEVQPPPLPSKLPPDFSKKLQEWEKKTSKSAMNPPSSGIKALCKKSSSAQQPKEVTACEFQGQPMRRKLPKGVRREDKSGKPGARGKDMAWLERELGKIEREKQRLEQEREKFLRREAR